MGSNCPWIIGNLMGTKYNRNLCFILYSYDVEFIKRLREYSEIQSLTHEHAISPFDI